MTTIAAAPISEAQALQAIAAYVSIRTERDTMERARVAAGKLLYEYIEANGQLTDAETGYVARLIERGGNSKTYDVVSLAESSPNLLTWLGRHGCLSIDTKAVQAMAGKAIEMLDLTRYAMPGPVSRVLTVTKT